MKKTTSFTGGNYTASFRDIEAAASGRWDIILSNLGVDLLLLSGRHLPCPSCKAGTDRFRWDKIKEKWICNTCTAHTRHKFRDGFNLLSVCLGIENNVAIRLVAEQLGLSHNQTAVKYNASPQPQKQTQGQQQDTLLMKKNSKAAQDHTTNVLADCAFKSHVYSIKKGIYHRVLVTNTAYVIHFKKLNIATGELENKKQTINANSIIIPLFDVSNPAKRIGAQFIYSNKGDWPKRPIIGTPIRNAIHILEGNSTSNYIGIAEGWATAKSVQLATGLTLVMAIDAGGLVSKAERIQALYPDKKIILFADNDESNTGQEAAKAAQQLTGGFIITPPNVGDDWSDYFKTHGLEQTKIEINRQLKTITEEL